MAEQLPKRCLYEILAVSRDASADEIRSAYRRLALHLHPDKLAAANGGTPSLAATAAFQDLHHAYEVLSDPKERAYYDSHRNQILFSDPSAVKSNKSFFNVDLYSYFTNSAFSGFSDSGRGFYKVYGDLFTKVYAQELSFAKESKLHPDTIEPSPLIGNLDSPYTQVSAFYSYWLSFDTVLDFAWVSVLNASAGTDRRERRQIEDEKKKYRKKAKREYNESVRGLAAFAKKRDKRVIDMLAKKKLQEEKQREKEKAKKEEEERMKMERAMAYEEPEWARVEEAEETEDESEDEEKGREEFKCVACNKKFKSDKQWTNHEQSRKHRDKVAQLKTSDVKETRVRLDYEAPRGARRRARKVTDAEANGVAGDESGTKDPGQVEEVEVVRKGNQVYGKNQKNKEQPMDGTMVLFVKKDSNGELKEPSRGRRKVIKYTLILFSFLFLVFSMGTLMNWELDALH